MPHFPPTLGDARRHVSSPHDHCGPAPGSWRAVRRGLKLSAKMMTAIPPEEIGRMMSGVEAAQLIFRLVEGRDGAEK
jgi:hypothetical protein